MSPVELELRIDFRAGLVPEAGQVRVLKLRGVARAAQRGEELSGLEARQEEAFVEYLVVRDEIDPLARPLIQYAADDLPRVREDRRCVEQVDAVDAPGLGVWVGGWGVGGVS